MQSKNDNHFATTFDVSFVYNNPKQENIHLIFKAYVL
jgi:hypothetical protein